MTTLPTTRMSSVSRVGAFGGDAAGTVEVLEEVQGTGGAQLRLQEAFPPLSGRPFWAEYHSFRAVLGVPGRRRKLLPVEVVLAPWSTGRTEVVIRFARPVRPEGKRRYFDAASEAVDALVRALEGRAAAAPRAATLRGGAAAPEGAAVGPQPDANAHTRLGAVA